MAHEEQALEGDSPLRRRLLRWKIGVAAVLVVVLLILSPSMYRRWRLARIPDIGDPFPVGGFPKTIPEEENAFLLLEEAIALRTDFSGLNYEQYQKEFEDGWDATDAQLNKYCKMNRAALEKWREATEKTDFQIVPVAELSRGLSSYMIDVASTRELMRLCQLEIERLTETDQPAEAMPWLRAAFRYSGLVTRNASSIDRAVGAAFFSMSCESAELWMQHPDVSARQLRDLLGSLQESAKLWQRPSMTVKVDYLISRSEYADWSFEEMWSVYEEMNSVGVMHFEPPLHAEWTTWLFAEPEFSRRVNAHVTANLLAFVDKPRRERPPLLDGDIFDEAAVRAAPGKRLPAAELIERVKDAKLINEDRELVGGLLEVIDRQQARYACLQVALASQAYRRERGEFPEKLADLIPGYLKTMPDDPYAPKPTPVIYRRTGEDAVVYSRFTNEKDDGGMTVTYDEARGDELLDYGFRIREPRETGEP